MNKQTAALWLVATAMGCTSAAAVRAEQAPPSASASPLEEIIVTAERRSVDLQKVALSVTAIDGADLERRGASDVAQVLQGVPGVVLQGINDGPSAQSVQGAGGPPNIAIRGVGTDGPNKSSSVAVYEDGVLLQGGGANFYDMSRVEVLRGPQGTLYGRGATGGAVNFITNDPTGEFAASGRLQYGSYGLIATQGMLNMPLSDAWSVRAAFNQIRHDGYFSNGMGDADDISTRVKLRYKPSEDLSLLLGAVIYKSAANGAGLKDLSTNPDPDNWNTSIPGGGRNPISYRKFFADFQAGMGFANLSYIGGYQTGHSNFGTNCTCFGGFTYFNIPSPLNNTWTHELRLASNGTGQLSWLAGAYYYRNRMETAFQPGAAPVVGQPFTPAFEFAQSFAPTSLGLFGEVTYSLDAATRLTGGLRETRDHIVQSATGMGVTNDYDVTFNRLDWKARAERDLSSDSLLYGMVSTGYRPGSFANGAVSQNEYVTAYEIGSKNRVDARLTLNGAIFYYDYSGFQSPYNVASGNAFTTVIVTVPARFYGAELEASWQPTPADRLTLTPAYLDAQFTADSTAGGTTLVATDGERVPHTPKWSLSGSYAHDFALGNHGKLSWQVDAHYQSEQLTDFDPSNYPAANPYFLQKAYTIYNSSLTWSSADGRYELSAYGRNLGNRLYKVTLYNPPQDAYVSDPRTWGVMLSAHL